MELEGKQATRTQARGDRPDKAERRVHWRRLLAGSGPREVLARLVEGDPLDVRSSVHHGLGRRAYLFDADRVFLRTLARIARLSCRYQGRPALRAWITERVDESLLDLLREDLEAERRGAPPEGLEGAAYEDLAEPLGLDPARMRAVCTAFNHLPETHRRAFFELVIAGRSLDELAGAETPAAELARRARAALEVALRAEVGG